MPGYDGKTSFSHTQRIDLIRFLIPGEIVQLRVLLLLIIVLFSFFGYITYLNHGIRVSLSLIQGRPISTSLPTLILVSFAAGALVIFLVGIIRDAIEGWKG